MEKIIPLAEKNRQLAVDRGEKKREKDRSYKNIHRVSKEFKLGQIVAHRQLQLATGVAMGMGCSTQHLRGTFFRIKGFATRF